MSSSYNATDSVSLSDYSVFYSDRKNSSSIMTEDFTADLCLHYYKSLIHSHTRAHTHTSQESDKMEQAFDALL